MATTAFALLATVTIGATFVLTLRLARGRRPIALADYLEMDASAGPPIDDVHALPFGERVLRPTVQGLARRVGRLTPGAHLDAIHGELLKAGLSSKLRAEEFVAIEAGSFGVCSAAALAYVLLAQPAGRLVVAALVLLPVIGILAPRSWLARHVQERQDRLRRDLPEVLDLLSLSVQAGLGFEAAIALVVDRMPSPLAAELGLTLREMELGRSRREAFGNLKRRTDVAELNSFVSAVVQADVLGVPIGKVLSAQAGELRLRRRQWARERANKLPVKILFPLLLFIFPAIFVILLGPAVGPLRDVLG